MAEEKKHTVEECHKLMAVNLFNLTWQLHDKKDRTPAEDEKMVHTAHASRFHWGEVGKPENLERGEWQISRVYAVLNRPVQALHHAQLCRDICTEHGIGDWDIAFAYEGMARAHAVAGNESERDKFLGLAREAGAKIKEKDDRDLFESEVKTVPGYTG